MRPRENLLPDNTVGMSRTRIPTVSERCRVEDDLTHRFCDLGEQRSARIIVQIDREIRFR